jgi:uncharacterized protein YdaU (DUF1376 family)
VKQLPYYKFYPADAESDERFKFMSLEERGLYWTLLNHSWVNDGIPFETLRLSRLCGISEDHFKTLWKVVGECFYLDNGRLRNKRLEEERAKAKKTSEARSENGKKGNASRWQDDRNCDSFAIAEEKSFAIVRAYDSDSISESKKEKKVDFELSDWFEQVYARHPKKANRVLAEQALAGLITSGKISREEFDRVHLAWCATEEWQRANGAFVRPLAEWITDANYKYMPNGHQRKESVYARFPVADATWKEEE